MAVQFVIGRAGTGKTQFCVDALSAASQADPLGPLLLWVVPEQGTFMSEQRLIAGQSITGSFRIRVVGFRRLCRFLAEELHLPLGPELSPIGRQLLLARAVQGCRENLLAYRQVAHLPGFLASLDRTLREIMQGGKSAQDLRAAAEQMRSRVTQHSDHAGAGVLADKLHDLALLLESWDNVRPVNAVDGEMLPGIIENALVDDHCLKNINIYVDSFSFMSVMEIRLLALLAKSVQNMFITLLADPGSPVVTDPSAVPAPLGIFRRTERLYQRLMRQFQSTGVAVEKPILLHTPHRFTRAGGLSQLESQLFAGRQHRTPPVPSHNAVTLLSCASPEEEVLCAGRKIRLLAAGGLRYRQIGVIVSDLALYEKLINTIFPSLNIPFFLDERQGLKFHPLTELLQALMALIRNNFARADLLSLVKTSLTGITTSDAYNLENYLLAHGIERDTLKADWTWEQLPTDNPFDRPTLAEANILQSVNAARSELYRALGPWIALHSAPQQLRPVAHYAQSLITLLESMQVGAVMEQWIGHATAQGAVEQAQIHQQVWSQCGEMLREMTQVTLEHTQTSWEFFELLQTVLENLTLGLIPPAVDQVLISSAQRSRHPELKAVLIMGALETLMPKATAEDGMINDADRQRLKPLFGDALNADTSQDFIEAAFFDYVAMTRPSERLFISYPAADTQGRKTAPSVYMARLCDLFTDVQVQHLQSTDINWPDFSALDELIRWVLLAMEGSRSNPAQTANVLSARAAQQWLNQQTDPAITQRWHHALDSKNRCLITPLPQNLGRFASGAAALSVSELETYAACPLQHFYRYTLHLQQRLEWQMDARSLGLMYHHALDLFYRAVISGTLAWPNCRQEDFEHTLTRAIAESTETLSAAAIADALELKAIAKPLHRQLAIILEAQRRAAQGNHFRPIATELRFGNFLNSDPAELVLPAVNLDGADAPLELRGKIDRLDLDPAGNALLVDYKSGAKKFNLGKFVHGLDLQLVAYLLAVRNAVIPGVGTLHPIGAFYYPLRPAEISVHPAPDEEPLNVTDPAYYKTCKPNGPFDNLAITSLDSRVEAGGSSDWFRITLKNNGEPHAGRNDGLDHPLFYAMLESGLMTMRSIAQGIQDGNIAPSPYKIGTFIPCSTCEFKSICPFPRQGGLFRNLDTTKEYANAKLTAVAYTLTMESR